MSLINSIFAFFRFNKKNWKAVALCLFAAMVFWFFNALNKNYSANISFPLVFDYNKEVYIPLKPLPENIRINVSGLGWDLFRKSIGVRVPALIVPLDKPADVRKIVGSTLPALFSTQLEGLQVNFILTDTLFVSLDQRASRTVKLALKNPQASLRNSFGITTGIVVSPDTVQLQGPRSLIEALPSTIELELPSGDIDENYNEEIEVIFPKSNIINRNPPVVSVSFNVERFVEVIESIPFIIVNAPRRAKPTFESEKVSLTYRLPESSQSRSNADSLVAIVDLQNVPRGDHRLIPKIVGLPQDANLIKIDSIRITF